MADSMADWSDDDAFWEAMETALCAPARLGLAERDVARIISALEVPAGAHVLDLGCGPGAHALAFAARGYAVTGVDRTGRLLERAEAASLDRGLNAEWVQADMREFRRPAAFDLVCSLYTSFGYFDDRRNRRVLENVLVSLKPGGALMLDLSGRETVARHWREHSTVEIEGVLYEERRWMTGDWSALLADWTVVSGGVRKDFHVRQRLYTGTELKELLALVGFGDVRLFGSLDASTPYDHRAERLVAIAHAGGSARRARRR
jgi:SAM-dependent methyltransferase